MRLSTVLQVSFVGALMFTPAMAEDIQQVHEQALKILRAQEAAPADTTSASSVREQREMLRRQQAAEAQMRRDRQQEERRRQFEAEQQRRATLRQQTLQSTPAGSPTSGSMSPEEMHEKALSILRNTQVGAYSTAPTTGELAPSQTPRQTSASVTQSSAPVSIPVSTTVAAAADSTPSPEVQERARQILKQQQAEMQKTQPAPAAVAAPATTLSGNTQEQEALHQRALEILHQQTAAPQNASPISIAQPSPAPSAITTTATAATPAPAVAPAPAQAATVQSTSPVPGASADVDLIHEQALRVLHQDLGQPTGVVQALDPKTREMIRRQNAEIAHQLGATHASVPSVNSTPTQASSMPQHELAPEMEARARQILRQQLASAGTATTAPQASNNTVPQTTATSVNNNSQEQIQYSRELEQKARQSILNNSQAAATTPAAPAPATSPTPSVATTPAPSAPVATPAPVAATTAAPNAGAKSEADIAAIHAQALDTMNHVLNPTPTEQSNRILSSQKSRREKLKELTDLYMTDKLTPAQYHEYRARILAQPQ